MKYVIVNNEKDVKTVSLKDILMLENCAQVAYEFGTVDVKLKIDGYFFDEKALTELIAFLAAAREYLISKQK